MNGMQKEKGNESFECSTKILWKVAPRVTKRALTLEKSWYTSLDGVVQLILDELVFQA
jgi:hypothetical protein